MKGAKTKLHISAPVGIAQAEIPTRGREFVPRRLYIRPTDYERHGFTQGCRGCTWQQNRVGPRPGHSENCRARLETEIAKVEGDDRTQRVQERQDHFVAAVVADSDKTRLQDPRQEDSNEPIDAGAADGAAPSTPVGGEGVTKFFDIGGDSPPA